MSLKYKLITIFKNFSDNMEHYKNEEVWYNFLRFALLLNRDPYFKPKKEDEIKKILWIYT